MREITAIGDMNRDGRPDLLAVETSTGRLLLYPGKGTGLGAGSRLGVRDWTCWTSWPGWAMWTVTASAT